MVRLASINNFLGQIRMKSPMFHMPVMFSKVEAHEDIQEFLDLRGLVKGRGIDPAKAHVGSFRGWRRGYAFPPPSPFPMVRARFLGVDLSSDVTTIR